jgi:autotransporter-associated beta strand protein
LPGLVPELERGWLVAVAADSNHPTQLADYSNACGTTMDYCLTAPGDVIVGDKDATMSDPNGYWVVSGTSFAAPAVSGAAALVWQAYPYFDNDLVRQTLLGTADDLGAPGVDATFGHGMLDVGRAVNGPAKFDWGDVTVDFTGGSVWNNPISGAGGLIKQGGGMLILTQPATYTGLTHVMEGTLVAKALAGSLVMDPNSVVRDTRAIAGSVANDGTLMVSGGDVTIGGDYAQGASGRLALELGSALRVTGAAALSGAGNGYNGADLMVIGAANGYVANTHTDVLVAQGGLTGTFSTLSLDAGVLLDATLDYDATSAWLNVVQVQASAVPDVTYSAASYAAAQRVDGAFGQLNAQLGGAPGSTGAGFLTGASSLQRTATPGALQHSLESLSGQLHAASAALTFEAIDAGTRALSDRFDRLLGSDAPGGWTQGLGYHGGMARAGYADVAVDLSGTLAGQDMRVGSNGVLGFALSQAQGLGRLAESADQGRSHAVEGMLYGGLVRGNGYLMGRVGLGNDRQLSRRNLQLGGTFAGVGSASHGRYRVGYGESGYRTTLGQLALTPYASVQYARIDSSGFNEPGAYGFGLKAGARTVERWQAGLGLRAAQRWDFAGGGKLDLQAHLAWQRAFAVRGDVFEASFTGLDQWAPLGGIGLSRYGGVAGMALDWTMSPHAGLSFGLDHRFAQREQGSMATLAYRLSF